MSMTRAISSSRQRTGSSTPARASAVRSRVKRASVPSPRDESSIMPECSGESGSPFDQPFQQRGPPKQHQHGGWREKHSERNERHHERRMAAQRELSLLARTAPSDQSNRDD